MRYNLFTETKFYEEYGWYQTYGILATTSGQTTYAIGDITLDKEKLLFLIAKFNAEKLELSHLEQAVEEFLYDFEV